VRAISAGNLHSLAMRDLISPTVTAVKPADDATGIGPGTNVSAFFSEAMTAGSIDTTTVKLFKAGEDSARKATVTYDGVANKATLDPNADLRRGDRYRVKVATGTKDLTGNRPDQGPSNGYQRMMWRFTVGN
jgi:type IV pilus assembly protein PilY1